MKMRDKRRLGLIQTPTKAQCKVRIREAERRRVGNVLLGESQKRLESLKSDIEAEEMLEARLAAQEEAAAEWWFQENRDWIEKLLDESSARIRALISPASEDTND